METINKRIRRLRIKRELTQKAVAKKLNISQSTYSAFEKNGKITTERALQLAIILDVELEEILTGHKPQPQENKESKKHENILRQDVLPGFNIGEYNGIILTKKEENRIKIIRQLSKEDEKKFEEFLNELHQKSKKK